MGAWKRLEVSTSNPVRSSDVRKLRQELLLQEAHWITEEEVDQILPHSKSKNIILVKCSTPKASVYVVEQDPVLFQPARSSLYYPTVYTLWKVRRWPALETISQVSKFLLGGADLMLPGVFRDDPALTWRATQVIAVRVRGNPCALAVGTTLIGSDSADKNTKGKVLAVEHFFGDALWEYGSKAVPNRGFILGEVVEAVPGDDDDDDDNDRNAGGEEAGLETSTMKAGEAPPPSRNDNAATTSASSTVDANHAIDEVAQDLEAQHIIDTAETENERALDVEPDQLLIQSFLQALKIHPSLALPIDASKFYTEFVVPSRPAGTALDLKATSYKKLGAFLKAMVKRKLIKTKEQRGAILIVEVDRNHELLQSFESHYSAAFSASETRESQSLAETERVIHVEEWFKAKPHQRAFLEALAAGMPSVMDAVADTSQGAEFFQSDQLFKLLEHYVRAHGLERPRNIVEMNEDLCSFLQCAPTGSPRQLPFRELFDRMLESMEIWHRIGRDGKLQRGRVKPIQVIVEDRQGGRKHITRIQRMRVYGIDDQQFAADAQRRFAAAATVSEIAGSAKKGGIPDTEVTLQGSFADEVVELLTGTYHVPAHLAEIVDKRKKRGK
jgi:translation initiation factor 2D